MYEAQILPFIRDYLHLLSEQLRIEDSSLGLTKIQESWLSFCLTGILLTNSICWTRYERASFGSKTLASLSWMFRRSKINWEALFQSSIRCILSHYGITEGTLQVDDTERERSKNAKHLYKLGKQKDKKSGGYFQGQSIIILLLVTRKVSIPVGFMFYEMDSVLRAWQKKEKLLIKKRVAKKHRTPEPERNPAYPTKNEIGVALVQEFQKNFSDIHIRSVNADALYGTSTFVEGVVEVYSSDIQVISQIRSNQNIELNEKEWKVSTYFEGRTPIQKTITIRGGKQQVIYYSSTIAKVVSQGKKRLIIALKYEGEKTYRYIIAQNMTWRVQDVLECNSLRWLIEVFNQDWKMYEAWGQLTKHVGEDGSRRSLILSLLFDHCLLYHPLQTARVEDKLPLYTVGSLRDRLCIESLLKVFEYILQNPNPSHYLELLTENILKLYPLRLSSKHLSGRTANFGST